jgi:hypothetical protein
MVRLLCQLLRFLSLLILFQRSNHILILPVLSNRNAHWMITAILVVRIKYLGLVSYRLLPFFLNQPELLNLETQHFLLQVQIFIHCIIIINLGTVKSGRGYLILKNRRRWSPHYLWSGRFHYRWSRSLHYWWRDHFNFHDRFLFGNHIQPFHLLWLEHS